MSGKRKGMSADEKKSAMAALIQSGGGGVFNKDELEKKGNKAGVVEKTVMTAVDDLVADRVVEKDKIGSGVFFWSFPSKALSSFRADEEAAVAEAARDEPLADDAERRLEALTAARGGADGAAERATKLARLDEAQRRRGALQQQLAAQADFDPEVLGQLRKKVAAAKNAADRWTDNAFALATVLTRKHGKSAKEAHAMLGLPDGFDYIS